MYTEMCPVCEWDVREKKFYPIIQCIALGRQSDLDDSYFTFSMQDMFIASKKTRKTIQTCAGKTKPCTVYTDTDKYTKLSVTIYYA